MTGFDALTVLLKAVGVYCCVFGLSQLPPVIWPLNQTNPAWDVTQPETNCLLSQPAILIAAGLFLAVEGRLVARVFGERPSKPH